MGRKTFYLTANLKTKKTFLFSCWLGNSHFSVSWFFFFFTFPKDFNFYLNEKSFPSFLQSEKQIISKWKMSSNIQLTFFRTWGKRQDLKLTTEVSRKVTEALQKRMITFFFLFVLMILELVLFLEKQVFRIRNMIQCDISSEGSDS